MQSHRFGLWLAGCLIIVISLFAGAVMGGLAGYIVANEQTLAPEVQTVSVAAPQITQPEVKEQPVAVITPAGVETQPLIVTEYFGTW